MFIYIILYFCEVFTMSNFVGLDLDKNFKESQIELDTISFTSKFKTLSCAPLTTIKKLEFNCFSNNLNKREIFK